MDIKQFTEKLSKSSACSNGKYVPWWNNWENDYMCRYNVLSAEEIAEAETLTAAATDEELTSPVYASKYSLFHLLVWCNLYNAVKSAIERKIDVDLTDGGGKGITPLMLACHRTNREMVKLLLDADADKNRTDASGRTCWHFIAGARTGLTGDMHCKSSSRDQLLEIADLLGDNVNAADTDGITPLAFIVTNIDNEVSSRLFDKLIAKGAKTDYKDQKGNSLLMLAIKNNHNTVALRLAHDKSLVNVANAAGETPLEKAEDFRKTAVCMALKENGAKGDSRYARLSVYELAQAASNAFAFFNENDPVAPALYLAQKLINTIDPDDDDEVRNIADILPAALGHDENGSVLDMIKKAGISLTEKFSSRGVWCLRDKCFSWRAGLGAIKKLVSMGIDINSAIVDGITPVHIIADQYSDSFKDERYGYFEDAARMFSAESATALDNQGVSAMHAAASSGHAGMLKAMAEIGADINVTQDAPAKAGNTPLHSACRRCNTDAVKTLIELGADETMKNVDGLTPAHIITDKNDCCVNNSNREITDRYRLEILKTLKTLDEPRNDGMTPLMLIQYDYLSFMTKALTVLLEAGVDVNRKDSYGRTALIIAADKHCYKDAIKELIRAGADLNVADIKGKTALHYALQYGSQDVARYLIKKGADYNRADNNGMTPASIAAEKGYDSVLEIMTDIK